MYLCLVHLNGCRNERLYLMELRTFICPWNQHTALSGMMNRPGPGHSTRSTSKPNYDAEYWFSITVIRPFSIGSMEAAVSSESYVNCHPPTARRRSQNNTQTDVHWRNQTGLITTLVFAECRATLLVQGEKLIRPPKKSQTRFNCIL